MEKIEYIDTIAKPVAEKRSYTVDYAGRMPEGATLASCAVSAINAYSGAAASSVISSGTGTISGNTASVFLQAGVADQRYVITFTATLSDGSILPDYVLMIVEAIR